MEETYWKQFMTTGKVEDYLHFKQVSDIEEKVRKEENARRKREGVRTDAGFCKCDSHCT